MSIATNEKERQDKLARGVQNFLDTAPEAIEAMCTELGIHDPGELARCIALKLIHMNAADLNAWLKPNPPLTDP